MPMDPLFEVSTVRGKNMRETCARVLAAALMTGAIATVVAMSALLGAPGEAGRRLAAPPSSLKRSVPVIAQPGPAQRVGGRPAARRASTPSRPVVVSRRVVVIRTSRRPPRRLAVEKAKPKPDPAPAPAPTPAPAPPTVQAQIVDPAPSPTPPAAAAQGANAQGHSDGAHGHHGNGNGNANGNGNGNANANGNGNGNGHDKHDE